MKHIYDIDTDIYSENYIHSAIESFQDITKIEFSEWKINVHGENIEEIEIIFSELMNFIIWLINE